MSTILVQTLASFIPEAAENRAFPSDAFGTMVAQLTLRRDPAISGAKVQERFMKIVFTVLCLFIATAAFAQTGAGAVSAEPRPIDVPSHPKVAMATPLALPHNLLGMNGTTIAQGELPLWQFAPKTNNPVSLGEVARRIRQEKAQARKATFVREN
jgi:hypothetical protein